MQGVPRGAPFMFIRAELMTHCAVDGRENAGDLARARRGVLRGGLRLWLARPLDPLNLKRIIPAKETSKVAQGASPVSLRESALGWAPTLMQTRIRLLALSLALVALTIARAQNPGGPGAPRAADDVARSVTSASDALVLAPFQVTGVS
ncbi:MAG: hypothetical protein JWQ62_2929, partial [Lacunisphaera sp.]|nr:hypothetical protein [Lacunisphaera sp.]